MSRYLRLSDNNVRDLTDMCESQGINVGIHGHMSKEQVTKYFDERPKPKKRHSTDSGKKR